MKPIYITEEELEYLTNVPNTLNEENEMIFSEEEYERDSKDCITLDQFSENIDKLIRELIPNP